MRGTMNFLYVAIGGAAGSVARYYLTGRVADWYGPGALGVFVVNINIVGSFMIGLFLTLATERFLWPPELRVLVAAGFLGGLHDVFFADVGAVAASRAQRFHGRVGQHRRQPRVRPRRGVSGGGHRTDDLG